jgi:microcystin-dependent protein
MSSGQQAGGESGAPVGGIARLSESEQKLVVKLLSDPTYFPVEFRTWLKQFFEGADIRITAGQIVGGGGSNVATGLPAGIILPVAAAAAVPADCLVCDGTAKIRTDYLNLFNAIGVGWGAGDGTTTFNIPDLRDRALYGQGGRISVAQTDGVNFGSRGGPDHHHGFGQTSGGGGSHSHSFSGNTGGGGSHQHAPSNQNFAETGGATAALGSGGTSRYIVADYHFYTANAGDHSHGFSGSTSGVGDHTHFVSGDTSGGYQQDRASFAGVIYVITIGASG